MRSRDGIPKTYPILMGQDPAFRKPAGEKPGMFPTVGRFLLQVAFLFAMVIGFTALFVGMHAIVHLFQWGC